MNLSLDRSTKKLIIEGGFLTDIGTAMRNFPFAEMVHSYGCGAIRNLTFQREGRLALQRGGLFW
jgi:hypothetical protein